MNRDDWKSIGKLVVLLYAVAVPASKTGAQASWTQLQANGPGSTNQPGARYTHSMSTWGTRGVILFGGSTQFSPFTLNDTWLWNGSTWTNLPQSAPPPAREGAGMAYDADH